MKKKTALIILVLLICSVLGILGNSFTKKLALTQAQKNSGTKTTVSIDNTKSDIESSKVSNTDISNQPSPASTAKASGATPEVKANTSGSSSNKSSATTSTKNDTGSTTVPIVPKIKNKNFYIINAITGETIYSSFETYSGQDSVSTVTQKVLTTAGISKKIVSSLSGDYYSMIAGFAEKNSGPNSGWCYYINHNKLSVGASGYNPVAGDIIEWKFLEDGTK
jgi:hypothetical protein